MSDTDRHGREPDRVPLPPHPERRQEPLPGWEPKPEHEDPDAPARVEALLRSPSYRQADQDVDFLNEDGTRGVRLQLDYSKAETVLRQHGVEHTIVVFGSTRIPEPRVARNRVDALSAALAENPGDRSLRDRLAVAERLLEKSRYYDVAREFGRLVANWSGGPDGRRVVIVTGGGPGIMEAANRGAYDAGMPSAGMNIALPHEQFPNPYITPDLCFKFHYFALRKLHFLLRARALVAFPGGFGTFDEVFETLTLIQTRTIRPLPVILVGQDYWRRAFDPDFLVAEGAIDSEDRQLFWFAETPAEIWDDIQHWYALSGQTLGT